MRPSLRDVSQFSNIYSFYEFRKLAEVTQKLNSLQELLAKNPSHVLANPDLSADSISGNSSNSAYSLGHHIAVDRTVIRSPSADMAESSRSSMGTSPPLISNFDLQPNRACFSLDHNKTGDPRRIESKQLGAVIVTSQTIIALFTQSVYYVSSSFVLAYLKVMNQVWTMRVSIFLRLRFIQHN